MLRAAEKHFPNYRHIQDHLLRHQIEFDAPESALKRIENLINKAPWWLSVTLEDEEIAALLPDVEQI